MDWRSLSFHFKQTYKGAYLYLDRCGEFMLAAEESLNLIPADAKPSGAKLELPEDGITVLVNTAELAVAQELPIDEGVSCFTVCKKLEELVKKVFSPSQTVKNGIAIKSYLPFATSDEMLQASLKLGGNFQDDLGKSIGMVSSYKKLDYSFRSGSMELQISVEPITFDKVNLQRRNAGFRSNPLERERVERANRFSTSRSDLELKHALILQVDLMENNPPESGALDKHFSELQRQTEVLRKLFIPKK